MPDDLTLEAQILVALRRITRAVDLRSRALLNDYGLTAPQLTTLHAINRLQPVTAGAVADAIHLGRPTLTGILNRLESRGLVARSRSRQDRRVVKIRLTDEGQSILKNAPSLLQDEFLDELAKLKKWERTQILATLQRIADMMNATRLEAVPVLSSELADAVSGDTILHLEASSEFNKSAEPASDMDNHGKD